MKEIIIESTLINADNEEIKVNTKGLFNAAEKTIEYNEDDLVVKISISKERILISRRNIEYDLNLEFKKNESIKCRYDVKSVGLKFNLSVFTKELIILENEINIKYELYDEEKLVGVFEYRLIFKEV